MPKLKLLVGSICAMAMLPATIVADDDDDDGDQIQPPLLELAVDCAGGDSINDAIALAPGFTRFTILVRGTCTEEVFIAVDNVTVRGDAVVGGRVEGQFTVDGARRVRLEDLTVSGGDTGLRVRNNAFVRATNVTIENMARRGVFALNGGTAQIIDTTILGPADDGILASEGAVLDIFNTTVDGTRIGISVSNGASLNVVDSSIRDTEIDGIGIGHGATARIVGNDITAGSEFAIAVQTHGHARLRNNTISSPDADGGVLFVDGGSVRLEGGNVMTATNPLDSLVFRNGSVLRQLLGGSPGNGPDQITGAISVESLSVASFSKADLTGDIRVVRHAELELRADDPGDVNVTGNIEVAGDSLILFRFDGGNVFGNLTCNDAESSLSIVTAFAFVSGVTDCSGFD